MHNRPCATTCRFVAYLDDAAPQEAEIIVWSEHHVAEGDEVSFSRPICFA